VVGVGVDSQEAEGDRILSGPLDLLAGKHPGGIAVDQQGQQHRWVVGLGTPPGVTLGQVRQVQLINDIQDIPGQMIGMQPFIPSNAYL